MSKETPGYIYLKRKIQDNWLWLSEPFTKAQAWVDLILLANYEDSSYYLRGNLIKVSRGEVAWSELSLSQRWKWSKNKLRGFLNTLEKEHQIKIERSNVINKIVLINYREHQDLRQQTEQQTEQQKDYRKTTEGTHIKESLSNLKVILKKQDSALDEEINFKEHFLIFSSITRKEIKSFSDERKKKLKKLYTVKFISRFDEWEKICHKIANSRFLMENKRLGIDWFLNTNNLTKLLEGNYDDRQQGATGISTPKRSVSDQIAEQLREINGDSI